MKDFNEFYGFADADTTLGEYFNRVFVDTVEMMGNNVFERTENSPYPKLVSGAIETIYECVQNEMGDMACCIAYAIVDYIYRNIVNIDDDDKEDMKESYGYDYADWETIYPEGVPVDEYFKEGKITSRPVYSFESED